MVIGVVRTQDRPPVLTWNLTGVLHQWLITSHPRTFDASSDPSVSSCSTEHESDIKKGE